MAPIALNDSPLSNGSGLKPTAKAFHPNGLPVADRFHSSSTEEAMEREHDFAAHNYHPLPVVFSKAKGVSVWDPEGRHYMDFLSSYSAVNQGHCHPELIKTLTEQASRLTLSSRAFYNDVFPRFAEYTTKLFGFDMIMPMNTGGEAVDTAIKLARRWGYMVKKIPTDQAMVWGVKENFHGRTFAAITMSNDPESRDYYGPYLPSVGCVDPETNKIIRYNNVDDVREIFEKYGDRTAAFLVEPIQGEAGVVVPDDSYLTEVRALCDKHNVLLICDEVQTGIARTGKLCCYEWSNIKPDMLLLGKAISGGMYPVSCVLASSEVMLTVEPGTHGSTYGGNPLGSAIAIRALELIEEENMIDRAYKLGLRFREGLNAIKAKSPIIEIVRGKGLLNAIVINEEATNGHSAWDLCMLMKEKGLVAKPTHRNIIRLAPPLVITEEQIEDAIRIIEEAVIELPSLKGEKEAKVIPPGEHNVVIGVDN